MTRNEYINRYSGKTAEEQTALHRAYYAQFVTPAVLHYVQSAIGKNRLLGSTDPHLNDIPLVMWDRMEPVIRSMCLSRMGNVNGAVSVDEFGRRTIAWSLSDAVCIAKEAARQFIEKETAEEGEE